MPRVTNALVSLANRYCYRYSILLTKGMLLHIRWLALYACLAPPEILAFVDDITNCEDIAMNAVVAALTGLR